MILKISGDSANVLTQTKEYQDIEWINNDNKGIDNDNKDDYCPLLMFRKNSIISSNIIYKGLKIFKNTNINNEINLYYNFYDDKINILKMNKLSYFFNGYPRKSDTIVIAFCVSNEQGKLFSY